MNYISSSQPKLFLIADLECPFSKLKWNAQNAANCLSNSSQMEYIQNAMEHSDRLSHIKTHKHLKSLTTSLPLGGYINIWVMEVGGEDECISVHCCLCSFEVKNEFCQFSIVYHWDFCHLLSGI